MSAVCLYRFSKKEKAVCLYLTSGNGVWILLDGHCLKSYGNQNIFVAKPQEMHAQLTYLVKYLS